MLRSGTSIKMPAKNTGAMAMAMAMASCGSPQRDINIFCSSDPSHVISHPAGSGRRIGTFQSFGAFNSRNSRHSSIRRRHRQMCQCWDPDQQVADANNKEVTDSGSFIGMLLEKAIAAFITSQLDHHSELKVSIAGNNAELLRGNLRRLRVNARKAVFRGISMSNVQLTASAVRFKFSTRRILRQPTRVDAALCFREEDLVSSLRSPLLSTALSDLFSQSQALDSEEGFPELSLSLQKGLVYLNEKPSAAGDCDERSLVEFNAPPDLPVALAFELKDDGQSLLINSVHVNEDESAKNRGIQRKFELGEQVQLKRLEVLNSEMLLVGSFLVSP